MSRLEITGLHASIDGSPILRGIDLAISSGEVHAVMGPNGAGKSTLSNVLMGKADYDEVAGSVMLDGVELLGTSTFERAMRGLYLAPQDPIEIPGVPLESVLHEALAARGRPLSGADLDARVSREAEMIGLAPAMLHRSLNVDASGGEKKRLEALQLRVLQPKIAILDEIDSGLDVDALRDVARSVARSVRENGPGERLGVLAITHYRRLLVELQPDVVHVLVSGRIVASGDLGLAEEIEKAGYAAYLDASAAPRDDGRSIFPV